MKNDLTTEHLRQEVTVTLPLSAVLRLAETEPVAERERVAARVQQPIIARQKRDLPNIGAEYEGGIYAGLSVENDWPVALVLLPGSLEEAKWERAVEWAKEQGGELPSRFDALVLFKNVKPEFAEAVYWTGEQPAGYSGYAWYQYFNYGYQYYWHKDYSYRARAVRRIPLQ